MTLLISSWFLVITNLFSGSRVRSEISFTPPSKLRVGWHWFIQPAREAIGFKSKMLSLFLRSEVVADKLCVVSLILMVLAIMMSTISTLQWFWSSIVDDLSFPFALYATSVGFFLTAFLSSPEGRYGMICWSKQSLSYNEILRKPSVPIFARDRVHEVELASNVNGYSTVYGYHETYYDPIIVAYIYHSGKCEKFIIAVYDKDSRTQLCE